MTERTEIQLYSHQCQRNSQLKYHTITADWFQSYYLWLAINRISDFSVPYLESWALISCVLWVGTLKRSICASPLNIGYDSGPARSDATNVKLHWCWCFYSMYSVFFFSLSSFSFFFLCNQWALFWIQLLYPLMHSTRIVCTLHSFLYLNMYFCILHWFTTICILKL